MEREKKMRRGEKLEREAIVRFKKIEEEKKEKEEKENHTLAHNSRVKISTPLG